MDNNLPCVRRLTFVQPWLSDHAHAAGHCVICHIQRLAKYAVADKYYAAGGLCQASLDTTAIGHVRHTYCPLVKTAPCCRRINVAVFRNGLQDHLNEAF